ncbi:hypothetical protein JCM8097_003287 [Rhodosporidiobolus ruineniae]
MDPLGLSLDPGQYASTAQPQLDMNGGDGVNGGGGAGWPQQHNHLETNLSSDDLAWLETQLSLAANGHQLPFASAAPPTPAPPPQPSLPSPPSIQGPHAFPPVSNARFHPYQLPSERGQRLKPPGGGHAHVDLLPPHLRQHAAFPPQRPPLGPTTSSTGPFDWPSFGSVATSFSPVPPPPHQPAYPPFPPPPPTFAQPITRAAVLYPPHDAPSPTLLPDEPTPTMPPAPHASPASYISSVATPRPSSPRPSRARRRRARSAPPPLTAPLHPPASPTKAAAAFAGAAPPPRSREATKQREETKQKQLDELFSWLDDQRWSFSHLFTALSDIDPGSAAASSVEAEHKRRMDEFLQLDAASGTGVGGEPSTEEGAKALKEAKRRWALKKGESDLEKGPDDVVRMWENLGGLGRKGEGSMANAVRELHSNVHDGHVAGVAIRKIINRYGEAYKESASDMKRLENALALPPSAPVASAPREANVWTGVLVIPTMQSEVLQAWLTAPGRPSFADERGKIEAEHMRIYSSLSPLDLHARGAELCRVILLRDASAMQAYGHNYDRLHLFTHGPVLAASDVCGFSGYDDASLAHHAIMVYLQLCVRYPHFREGKEATVAILPDLPPPVHPTPLETLLIDRALHDHWEALRLFLLDEHGGLLRSAVRSFGGVKLSKIDLLSVCDDTKAVMVALGKNKKNPNDRILPYDPSISQIRNAWRNTAYYDATADLVIWSAATTHFLELSALFPEFGMGVRDLPGLESLLSGGRPSSAAGAFGASPALPGGPSPMAH